MSMQPLPPTPEPVAIPTPNPSHVNAYAVLGPLAIQVITIICITLITLFASGVSGPEVVAWLSVLAAGNAVGAGTIAGIHSIVSGRVQQTSIQTAGVTAASIAGAQPTQASHTALVLTTPDSEQASQTGEHA